MNFYVHTLEYKGGPVSENLEPRNYTAADYAEYKQLYEDSFYDMRHKLGLPRECCKSSDELLANKSIIFILEINGCMIGSVAVYGNEIDDLFVAAGHQRHGYGQKLLRYAVSYLQKANTDRIVLHAADINKSAVSLYTGNGFIITETKEISR